jgi:Nucleoside diphosphate kinase
MTGGGAPTLSLRAIDDALALDAYGWEIRQDLKGLSDDVVSGLLRTRAAILFKPEAIVRRRVVLALDYLARRDLHPVGSRQVKFNRNLVREFWRASPDLMRPTREFCALLDLYLTDTPWLYVLLRREGPANRQPASRQLARWKGSSYSAERRQGQLRTLLSDAGSMPLFTYVHCADDEVAFLRELALFFGVVDREGVIQDAVAGERVDIRPALDVLYRDVPEHDLDFDASLRRIVDATRGRTTGSAIARWCREAASAEAVDWTQLDALLRPFRSEINNWDIITVGAWLTLLPPRNTTREPEQAG